MGVDSYCVLFYGGHLLLGAVEKEMKVIHMGRWIHVQSKFSTYCSKKLADSKNVVNYKDRSKVTCELCLAKMEGKK